MPFDTTTYYVSRYPFPTLEDTTYRRVGRHELHASEDEGPGPENYRQWPGSAKEQRPFQLQGTNNQPTGREIFQLYRCGAMPCPSHSVLHLLGHKQRQKKTAFGGNERETDRLTQRADGSANTRKFRAVVLG